MTPAGIEPATIRFVAQHLNHCATAVPITIHVPHIKKKNCYMFRQLGGKLTYEIKSYWTQNSFFWFSPSLLSEKFLFLKRIQRDTIKNVHKNKVHPCTGTEALYRPYGP